MTTRKTAGAVPEKKAAPKKECYDQHEQFEAGQAASALLASFVWSRHPWGNDFWRDVYHELDRISYGGLR